jgi:hypothetical protein
MRKIRISRVVVQEDDRSDDNPRECVIFRIKGYHDYRAPDGKCTDCAKPNPARVDNGK